MHFCFEFPKDEVDWPFFSRRFQYLVHISEKLHELESFEQLPAYLSVRAYKSAIPSDPPSPSHQTSLVPQVEVGDIENSFLDLSPSSPTLHTQNHSVGLDYESHCYCCPLGNQFLGYGEIVPKTLMIYYVCHLYLCLISI